MFGIPVEAISWCSVDPAECHGHFPLVLFFNFSVTISSHSSFHFLVNVPPSCSYSLPSGERCRSRTTAPCWVWDPIWKTLKLCWITLSSSGQSVKGWSRRLTKHGGACKMMIKRDSVSKNEYLTQNERLWRWIVMVLPFLKKILLSRSAGQRYPVSDKRIAAKAGGGHSGDWCSYDFTEQCCEGSGGHQRASESHCSLSGGEVRQYFFKLL